MTRIFACLSLFFFLVPVTYVHGPKPPKNTSQVISLTPVAFDSSELQRTKTGRLEFIAGWKLTSENHDFGGVSSMLVETKPGAAPRFFMLSDAGVLIGFTLDEANGRALRPFIAPLPDGPEPENEHARKNWDSESLVTNSETGQFWVGFERGHGIWRYGPSFARKEASHKVAAMQKWPINGSAEAMLRIAGEESLEDRFLVFSESADYSKGGYQALLFNGDPTIAGNKPLFFGYRPPRGYNLTDAALLPNGKAILLHRRFTPIEGVSAIISIGDPQKIEAGKIWDAQPVATLKPPLKVDNMEAVAVTQEGQDVIIWLASDDNFNAIQETLLMKFRLGTGKVKRTKPLKKTAPESEKAEASPGFSTLP